MAPLPSDAIALGLTAFNTLLLWAKQVLPVLAAEAPDGGPAACAADTAARHGQILLATAAALALLSALSLSRGWQRRRRWIVSAVRLVIFTVLPWQPQLCAAPSCAAVDGLHVLVGELTSALRKMWGREGWHLLAAPWLCCSASLLCRACGPAKRWPSNDQACRKRCLSQAAVRFEWSSSALACLWSCRHTWWCTRSALRLRFGPLQVPARCR